MADNEITHPLREPHIIDKEEEIPDLCKSLFLTKEKFLSIVWIVAGLILTGSFGCIAWAMTTTNSITELKSNQVHQDSKIEALNNEIIRRLDIIIKQKE